MGRPAPPVFSARLDPAADLYRDGRVRRALLTGGASGAAPSEAGVGRAYLLGLGVAAWTPSA